MADKKWALTPACVARLGAEKDFRDVYEQIKDVYDAVYDEHKEESASRGFGWFEKWDKLCRPRVRKLCEPLLNKYLYVFTSEYTKIFANAFGFSLFSLLYWDVDHHRVGALRARYITFADFLAELAYAVSRIFFRWLQQENSACDLHDVCLMVNEHIRCIDQGSRAFGKPSPTAKEDILYQYEQLSSTSCYRQDHPVISAIYAAKRDGQEAVALPVHFCQRCQKYFIGRRTRELYEKCYGRLGICYVEQGVSDDMFDDFAQESYLHQLGYQVKAGGLTERERHDLLITLLEENKISYLEMCATIEQNIRNFSSSVPHAAAVEKWRGDLRFIGEYVKQQQS